jgi:quercetin dioxygenase-like cupin family protein
MALHHADPGELIDVRPLGSGLRDFHSQGLLKTARIEVMRFVLAAGDRRPEHRIDGEMTVQCLEGEVRFNAMGRVIGMKAGDLLYLNPCEPYSMEAALDSSLLVTMLIEREQKD